MADRRTRNTPLNDAQLEDFRVAVYLSGGHPKVGKAMGYSSGEMVRRFTAGEAPVPAERCEALRKAIDNRLTLAQIRPDLYGKLKTEQLGYAPKAGKGAQASA